MVHHWPRGSLIYKPNFKFRDEEIKVIYFFLYLLYLLYLYLFLDYINIIYMYHLNVSFFYDTTYRYLLNTN